jgi:hypothetical protein
LVKWARASADTEEMVQRVQKETGTTVSRSSIGRELARARARGLDIPNFRMLYGADLETPTAKAPAPEQDADNIRLERKLARARGTLDQERKRTSRLQKELHKAQEVIDFRRRAEGYDEEIRIRSPRRLKKSLRAGTPILMASDWHVEEVVDVLKVNHVNEYNPDIAKSRAGKFFRGVTYKIQQAKHEYDCREAVLWLGGDFITGFIHESYKENNAMSPIQAIHFWKGIAKAGIEMMLEQLPELEKLYVVCNYGNHGRTTRKPVDGAIAAANSFEHAAYIDLAELFEGNDRVEFKISAGTLEYVQIYEWTLRFTHGDKGVKFRDAIGGISTAARKAVMGWDTSRPADYTILGHWHQWITPFSDIIVNGSLIGYNPFAMDIKARWEPPQQGFWILDEERGRRHTESIWVSSYGARKPVQ